MTAVARLAAELNDGGGLIAAELLANPTGPDRPAAALSGGPRVVAAMEEYELVVEAIYEGYLLHYGASRVLRCADPDLRLLAGDRLYALGLERLVGLGDVAAVAELADVISLCALVHSRDRPDLAVPIWEAGTRAVGWGASEAHERAKRLLWDGDPEAETALRLAG